MSNQLARFNRVRYKIYGDTFGTLLISEPVNWDNDQKELKRSEKYFGITANINNANLQFYGDAFSALKSEYDINGIKAVVRIERESRNEQTDNWEVDYMAFFDFKTYRQNKNFIEIKLNENEFFNLIESSFKDNFELERLTDLKGNPLEPLEYKNLTLQGRDIFRESYFDNDDQTIFLAYQMMDLLSVKDVVLPLNLKFRSDENVFSPTSSLNSYNFVEPFTSFIPADQLGGISADYTGGHLFYLNNPQFKQLTLKIKINLKVRGFSSNGAVGYFSVFQDRTIPDDDDNLIYDAHQIGFAQFPCDGLVRNYSINYEETFNLVQLGGLGLRIRPRFTGEFETDNVMQFEISKIEVTLQETDVAQITECKALTYYQVFERLIRIITGKNTFQSNLLSEEWRDLLFTNGFKIRNNPEKNITTSLEEVYNSLNSFDDIGLFIKGNTIRVEKKADAFLNQVSLDLGKVANVERNIEEKLHYSIVEIGNDFNGEYEEVNGLDEYNIRTSYKTCLGNVDNKLSAISKVRTDSYGITLAQEKQYVNFPKLDTKYDKVNFAIDCILISANNYEVRHWQLDFASEPTGIFSPATAFNLRLSPFNSVLRKSKTISTGLLKYPNERFQYSSTEGNSQLVTEYPERANILNSVLSSPYFLPETITFDRKISMIEFNTLVNNPYKLIKFVNEFDNIEYGFIYPSVKPNKEGKFILIKANV